MAALCVAVKARCLLPGRHRRYPVAMTDARDPEKTDPRKERLAAALRANLRRRKAQGREQDAAGDTGVTETREDS